MGVVVYEERSTGGFGRTSRSRKAVIVPLLHNHVHTHTHSSSESLPAIAFNLTTQSGELASVYGRDQLVLSVLMVESLLNAKACLVDG